MKLRNYIYLYPRGKRIKIRKIIADALGVAEVTVKSWENGFRRCNLDYVELIENLTDGKVTKYDW